MQKVNYIKHLNAVFQNFTEDRYINPTHISLYMALFQIWNQNRFIKEFMINREEIMQLAKIGSTSTYHRCIKQLHQRKYLTYSPSKSRFVGSKIMMFEFRPTNKTHAFDNRTTPNQVVGPYIKHNKTSINNKQKNNFKEDFLKVNTKKNYNQPL